MSREWSRATRAAGRRAVAQRMVIRDGRRNGAGNDGGAVVTEVTTAPHEPSLGPAPADARQRSASAARCSRSELYLPRFEPPTRFTTRSTTLRSCVCASFQPNE